MDRPHWEEKGAVFIRTLFGEVSEDCFPALSRADMIEDTDWRAAAGVEGGPFCYVDSERFMPF
jgi:hypothetical protein